MKNRVKLRDPSGMFPSGSTRSGAAWSGLAASAERPLLIGQMRCRPRPLAVAAGEARARVCGGPSWASRAAAKEAQVSIPCEARRGGGVHRGRSRGPRSRPARSRTRGDSADPAG